MFISTINFELCHLDDCTFVITKNLRRVIQDCKIQSLPAHIINLYYMTIYAWRSVYGCIDHDAVVTLLNAFAAAAIIGEHGPLFHYRRKVAPVEYEVSRLHLQTLHESVIVSPNESLVESALRVRSVYNSI